MRSSARPPPRPSSGEVTGSSTPIPPSPPPLPPPRRCRADPLQQLHVYHNLSEILGGGGGGGEAAGSGGVGRTLRDGDYAEEARRLRDG